MVLLRTPFQQDIPQAFIFYDTNGSLRLVGPYAQLIRQFARYARMEMEMVYEGEYKSSDIQRLIQMGFYNVSMNGGIYKNLFANVTFSYPLEWSNICIMVPTKDELPHYWYVLWPFGPFIWLLLWLCVPYVALLMTCLKHPTAKFGQNLFHSLAVVMCVSNTNMKLANITLRLQIFYLHLMAMGFIFNSYYCSYLTVYTLRPVYQPPLKTIDDILDADLPVLVPSRVLEELLNTPYVNLTRLMPALGEMPGTQMSDMLKNFTRSYGFIVSQIEWSFIKKLQRNLIQPLFQKSDICFGDRFTAYPMQINSEFAESLDLFIFMIKEAGLWEHWKEEAFISAIKTKYYHIPRDDYPVEALNLKFFGIAWIVFFVGLALGGLSFVGEVIVHRRYKKKRLNIGYEC